MTRAPIPHLAEHVGEPDFVARVDSAIALRLRVLRERDCPTCVRGARARNCTSYRDSKFCKLVRPSMPLFEGVVR